MANVPWERVYPILAQLLAHANGDRPALLDRLCGTDQDLRAEVEQCWLTTAARPKSSF
jgi:hypothetical protein